MAATPEVPDAAGERSRPDRPAPGRLRATWRLTVRTVLACVHYRVTGLAAEVAFFALLSLPPLVLGSVGTLGYLTQLVGQRTLLEVQETILSGATVVLSARGVNQVLAPMLRDVLSAGRPDVISLGFLVALWSGSRALNVYIETITIAYGLEGRRGIVRTRLLSFLLYLVALVVGVVLLPLVVLGPDLVAAVVPSAGPLLQLVYLPVVVVLSVPFLATLYHLSVPVRTPWRQKLPGALLALVVWLTGSALLRLYLRGTFEVPSVYGSLFAPIAVLLWLYVTALAVIIGAALNAELNAAPAASGPDTEDKPSAGDAGAPGPR